VFTPNKFSKAAINGAMRSVTGLLFALAAVVSFAIDAVVAPAGAGAWARPAEWVADRAEGMAALEAVGPLLSPAPTVVPEVVTEAADCGAVALALPPAALGLTSAAGITDAAVVGALGPERAL
jgi:hypothetical protein